MELKTSIQRRGQGLLKAHWRRREGQGAKLCEPSVNKQQEGLQQACDKPLPDVENKRRWQIIGLRPWAPTIKWLCSVEEQTVNHHKTLTVAAS
jgi:hypothetical protein